MDSLDLPDGLAAYEEEHRFTVETAGLQPGGWALVDVSVQQLIEKIRSKGIPLGEYVQGKIYYGIKTGLNAAFVIDAATRDRLIAEDPRSADIIKPVLAGRDIKRYTQPVATRYLIFTRWGIDIEQYPAILNYLTPFKDRLMPRPKGNTDKNWPGRKPGTYAWYEIQDAVDYYEEFEKPKIVLAEIAGRNQFTIDYHNGYYDTTAYIMPIPSYFLLGLCNSKLFLFYFSLISSSIRGGFLRWKRQYMEAVPVYEDGIISEQVAILAEQAFQAGLNGDHTQQLALEEQIDRLVEELYGVELD